MEPLVLIDKSVTPTDELVFSIIGKNKSHWQRLMTEIQAVYPDALGQWNYYNDGKNWLFKMILKKKTLFWIGILKDSFRITFYFGDKAEPLIEKSTLPETMKSEFKTSQRYGKIRAISLKVNNNEDIENAIKVAAIKASMK
jgi:hypothetical protein